MKSFSFVARVPIMLSLVFLFGICLQSCEKQTASSPANYVPADAAMVMSFDLERLIDKIDWDMIAEKTDATSSASKGSIYERILLRLESTGIDFEQEAIYYTTKDEEGNQEYGKFIAGLSNEDSLINWLQKDGEELEIQKNGGQSYAVIGATLVVWNDQLMCAIMPDGGSISTEAKTLASEAFTLPSDGGLVSASDAFVRFQDGPAADLSVWTGAGASALNKAAKENAISRVINWDLLQDTWTGVKLNFDKGTMVLESTFYADKEETVQFFREMADNSMNSELLSLCPENTSAAIGFSLNSEAWEKLFIGERRDVLQSFGLEGESLDRIDVLLQQADKFWEGDALIAFSGLQKNPEMGMIPSLTAALSISDVTELKTMLKGMTESGAVVEENGLYTLTNSPIAITMAHSNDAFVLSSAGNALETLQGSGNNSVLPGHVSKLLSDHTSAFWADPELIMSDVINAVPMAFLVSGIVTENFDEIVAWSETDGKGQLTQTFRIEFIDKEAYSINTLISLILDLSQSIFGGLAG